MDLLLLFSYVFIFFCFLFTVVISFKLYEKYKLRFLYFFLTYIITHNILGFFNLFGTYLNTKILSYPFESQNLVPELLGFLSFPFIPVMLFMFLSFIAALLDLRLSQKIKNLFFVFWGILFLIFVFYMGKYFTTRDSPFLPVLWGLTYLAEGSILYAATSYLMIRSRVLPDKNRGKWLINFGMMYFMILTFYALSFLRVLKLNHFFYLIFHFTFNIPLLIFLILYLRKYYYDFKPPTLNEENLNSFFNKYNITQREKEVILLLLKGKRLNDIEKDLFISYHTVKNHVHNIYQKLGIRNRLQLNNLIRDYLK